MKVTLILRNDHDRLRGLIEKFKNTAARRPERKTLFEEMRNELHLHEQTASEVFYSALTATPSDRAASLVASAQERCESVEKLFHELNRMNPADHNFDSRMNALIAEIGRHIEMEEDELFHEARKALPEYRLEELGLEMQMRRDTLKMLAAV